MKKLKVELGMIGLFLVIWVGFSLTLPPKLVASSEDEKFNAIYTVSHSLKETWAGELTWDELDGEIVDLSFYENDTQLTGDFLSEPIDMRQNSYYEFVFLGSEPNSDSDYTLRILWKASGESHEEVLTFKEKKRFFVLPTLD
ncbi:hypothetical protein EVJ27_07625 [Exiguobacterium sp. SH3S2]|uniref:hypothetical protein n=1 Tax=Exiguobacterium TaxID=33986 RepID=UPI0008778B93|nr:MULTISPECIES: hypothetical protein [Exiguobacterium]TCI26203.1 hypothetical protein EVJ32_07145 [Exiguobacterium sp. SH5S4]TCI43478.1 hypothetical protein EVJ31_11435 [Exiguobacterium sp. SH5S32]TCI45730.1 hypothetical protein EVJ28_07625 [Exiguobacterium sp. SH3S3]TCI52426.1 hypothetical protein EVJ25_06630 [Exiguobacterium sp. SH1S4]TCI60114.1 hypothetical protein EVJ26_11625 [Exiguobacterium sp. SH3S1]